MACHLVSRAVMTARLAPAQPDERLGAEWLGVGDGEAAEPVDGDVVAPGELAGQLDALAAAWGQGGRS